MTRLARTLPRLAAGPCLSLPAAAMVFEPASRGHATPDGVTRWGRAEDQPFTVTPQQPGQYFICPPHRMMGMVGPVQAGEAVNKQAASDRMQRAAWTATASVSPRCWPRCANWRH